MQSPLSVHVPTGASSRNDTDPTLTLWLLVSQKPSFWRQQAWAPISHQRSEPLTLSCTLRLLVGEDPLSSSSSVTSIAISYFISSFKACTMGSLPICLLTSSEYTACTKRLLVVCTWACRIALNAWVQSVEWMCTAECTVQSVRLSVQPVDLNSYCFYESDYTAWTRALPAVCMRVCCSGSLPMQVQHAIEYAACAIYLRAAYVNTGDHQAYNVHKSTDDCVHDGFLIWHFANAHADDIRVSWPQKCDHRLRTHGVCPQSMSTRHTKSLWIHSLSCCTRDLLKMGLICLRYYSIVELSVEVETTCCCCFWRYKMHTICCRWLQAGNKARWASLCMLTLHDIGSECLCLSVHAASHSWCIRLKHDVSDIQVLEYCSTIFVKFSLSILYICKMKKNY